MFIAKHGDVDFFHYDFYGQALAKIQRGTQRDLSDVEALVELKLVDPRQLLPFFETIRPEFLRYPALESNLFGEQVRAFAEKHGA